MEAPTSFSDGTQFLIEELEDGQLAACVGGCHLQLNLGVLDTNRSVEVPLGEPTGETVSHLGLQTVSTSLSTGLLTTSAAYDSNGSARFVSDRTIKEAFTEVDAQQVLAKVATLPITTWKYTQEPDSVRHMGPMAQDFAAMFGVGDSDRSIHVVDANGVTLAAIQGLYQLLQERDAELDHLKAEMQALKQQLQVAA